MPRRPFAENSLPSFDQAPSVVLVCGDTEFFVEEAADRVSEVLSAGGAESLRFDDGAPPGAVTEALLNRSLFSPRRVVRLDVSRLLGTDAPARLLAAAVEAWGRGGPGGRREAFRQTRALLSALGSAGSEGAAELAEAVTRRLRRREDAQALEEILRELPGENGGPALVGPALRRLLDRPNDGVVALLTAAAPPKGVELLAEIEKKGLVLEQSVGEDPGPALSRLARARAREREVTLDPEAVERLLVQTDRAPGLFAAELEKLLDWAGKGGRVRAADVRTQVEDESSEDVYLFFDAVGRRDAGDALSRLARLFSGRDVRMGDRAIGPDDSWPVVFFGMLTTELRRMLLLKAALEGRAAALWEPAMPFTAFQARLGRDLEQPVPPFGRSPFEGQQGKVSAFLWYKVAQRASRYQKRELARALCRAAEVDLQLKSSTPPLEAISAYVGRLIAGD